MQCVLSAKGSDSSQWARVFGGSWVDAMAWLNMKQLRLGVWPLGFLAFRRVRLWVQEAHQNQAAVAGNRTGQDALGIVQIRPSEGQVIQM